MLGFKQNISSSGADTQHPHVTSLQFFIFLCVIYSVFSHCLPFHQSSLLLLCSCSFLPVNFPFPFLPLSSHFCISFFAPFHPSLLPFCNFSCHLLLMFALPAPSSSRFSPAALGTDGRPAGWKGPDRGGGGQAAGPESCRGWDWDAAHQSDCHPWPGGAAAHGAEDAGGRDVGPQDGRGIRKKVGRGGRRSAWTNNHPCCNEYGLDPTLAAMQLCLCRHCFTHAQIFCLCVYCSHTGTHAWHAFI